MAAVEAQLAKIFERVLRPHQGPRRLVEPIEQTGQQKAQRAAACQERQGSELGGGERSIPPIAVEQQPRLGHVEAAIGLKAPGVKADRQVVGEEVGAGEIEIDQAGKLLLAERKHYPEKDRHG